MPLIELCSDCCWVGLESSFRSFRVICKYSAGMNINRSVTSRHKWVWLLAGLWVSGSGIGPKPNRAIFPDLVSDPWLASLPAGCNTALLGLGLCQVFTTSYLNPTPSHIYPRRTENLLLLGWGADMTEISPFLLFCLYHSAVVNLEVLNMAKI